MGYKTRLLDEIKIPTATRKKKKKKSSSASHPPGFFTKSVGAINNQFGWKGAAKHVPTKSRATLLVFCSRCKITWCADNSSGLRFFRSQKKAVSYSGS